MTNGFFGLLNFLGHMQVYYKFAKKMRLLIRKILGLCRANSRSDQITIVYFWVSNWFPLL